MALCKRIYLKKNPQHRLSSLFSWGIRNSLKRYRKAHRHWESLVSYTYKELEKRLKITIPDGYNWQDYITGQTDLHIDHIIPVSAFNFNKPEDIDFQRCWALDNLQLLPAKKNISKNNKLEKPFQPSFAFGKT